MGINGALSSAVAGLRAQSHALENISGNIANSQTVGYKRIETDFLDLIPDAPLRSQVAGAVLAQSRGTNNIQGDIRTSASQTFIALNTNGFLVVEPKSGQSDGNSVFAGANFYTRRGDFELDKDGLLVNGAGYYLKGLPVDAVTGNISGSVPEIIKVSNAFMPANPTKTINYQANLPQLPKTASYNAASLHSELIKPWTYSNPSPNPNFPSTVGVSLPTDTLLQVPARASGSNVDANAAAATVVNDGDMLSVNIGNDRYNLWFDTDGVPNSAISLINASEGAYSSSMRILVAQSDIAALHGAGDLMIGGTPIPFSAPDYSADIAGLLQAVSDAIPGIAVGYNTAAGRLNLAYATTGQWAPTPSASGTGASYDSSFDGYTTGSAVTTLSVDRGDLLALNRTGQFQIGNTVIPFSAPIYSASGDGLTAAIRAAFPGANVHYQEWTGTLTITYPPGARAADTIATGIGASIPSSSDVEAMIAHMQSELRSLSGDDTLFLKLKNGRVTVSNGIDDPSPLQFSSARAGSIGGPILGLSPGPFAAIPADSMTADNTYADLLVTNADKLVVSIGEKTLTYSFDIDGRQTPGPGETEIDATGSLAGMLAAIQADLRANGGWGAANAKVSYGANGVQISFPGNYYYDVSISGSIAEKLDIDGKYAAETGGLPAIAASDADRFLSESTAGGAITVYAKNGAPADVQLRWAKIDSATADGPEKWNLYYLADSKAVGGAPMWVSTGQDYVFDSNGTLVSPGVPEMTISGLIVNGVSIGDVKLQHDRNGVSQFADVNGTVSVSTLNQNGYGAGEFQSVAIADSGRVVATYSNGERLDIAQIIIAQFSAENALRRLDGGVFQATSASGDPIFDQSGSGIIGGALEASNTDISDEFTKLIVTQQAYSAGTRIISVTDELMQEALNMVR